MRNRKIIIAAITGTAIVSGGFAAYAMSQAPEVKGTSEAARVKETQPAIGPFDQAARLAEMREEAARTYTVEPEPVRGNVRPRTAEHEGLFKEAATIVSRFQPVPHQRIQFYGWLNEPKYQFNVYGWSIFVTEVNPLPGGWSIKLHVWPKVIRKDGASALVDTPFVEQYTWSNGVLTFVNGAEHPVVNWRIVRQ